MRVAFFHDHKFRRGSSGRYFSGGGLPYPVLQRYLEHFDSLIVTAREYPLGEPEDVTRLTLASGPRVELQCIDGNASRAEMLLGPRTARHVRGVMSRVDCAIIRLPSLIGLVACREAVRMRKPWMAEVVACAWDGHWNHGSLAGKPAAPVLFALNRYFIGRATHSLYVSEKFLQRRYPCKGITTACSDVVVPELDPSIFGRRLQRIADLTNRSEVTLGVVGSLDIDYKGHDTAIRAVALLKRTGLPVRLRCLGGGSSTRWRSLAGKLGVQSSVEFCGTLPSGQPVLEWMDSLDLFVIPSLQEGLPRALVEAMSRGAPAVGAHTGGIPELIQSDLVHPPKDPRALAGIIGNLVKSCDKMREVARRNYCVAERYSEGELRARRSKFLAGFRAFGETHGA
jgi:glycosyltransferase involved in cell wall biosynthesis